MKKSHKSVYAQWKSQTCLIFSLRKCASRLFFSTYCILITHFLNYREQLLCWKWNEIYYAAKRKRSTFTAGNSKSMECSRNELLLYTVYSNRRNAIHIMIQTRLLSLKIIKFESLDDLKRKVKNITILLNVQTNIVKSKHRRNVVNSSWNWKKNAFNAN